MNTRKHVTTRKVFYIPGYDPFPARRYRELYRTEGGQQARISGYEIALTAKPKAYRYGWRVKAVIDGKQIDTEYEVLEWSDLVQASMQTGILATYAQLFITAWIYISTGALRRLSWLRKGPIVAALYPIGLLLAQALIAVFVAWVAGAILSRSIYPNVGWIVALPIIVVILRWFRKHDSKFFAYYLMHDYAFSARLRGANPPELEQRMQVFAQAITSALTSDVDEVLVVGHSSGVNLAVSILADVIRANRVPPNSPALGFLSLGQVVPMQSFLPNAHRLRADLRDLSVAKALTWVDVSAPGDGCSFALCDPVSVSGVAPNERIWPLVISAAFSQTLSPERWQSMRRRYFRLHFQYLCAFDRPADYDYFQITAGAMTLGGRFRGRKPSNSRIDVAASRYRSVRA